MTEAKRTRREDLVGLIQVAGFLTGIAALMIGPAIGVYELWGWLKTGEMNAATMLDALNYVGIYPHRSQMIGLQRILDWMLRLEFWWAMPVLVVIVLIVGFQIYEAEKAERARQQDKANAQ